MSYQTPNMNLLGISIGVDTGLTIETNYNTNANTLDSHNHASGSGVQITPAGINISSDLSFNGNNVITLRSSRYTAQASPLSGAADLGCLYVSGLDLYYNDLSGNQVRITTGGSVNATSSGIASGTATASFVSSVLVVNQASNTPANIRGGSLLLGNNTAGSNFVTLSPPSALASNYSLVLPSLPASTLFVTLDSSGNLGTAGSIQGTQIASASITGSQLANQTVTATQIANATITATQMASASVTPGILYTPATNNAGFNPATTTSTSYGLIGSVSVTVSGKRPVLINLYTQAETGLGWTSTNGEGAASLQLTALGSVYYYTNTSATVGAVPFAWTVLIYPTGYPTGSSQSIGVGLYMRAISISGGTTTASLGGGVISVTEL